MWGLLLSLFCLFRSFYFNTSCHFFYEISFMVWIVGISMCLCCFFPCPLTVDITVIPRHCDAYHQPIKLPGMVRKWLKGVMYKGLILSLWIFLHDRSNFFAWLFEFFCMILLILSVPRVSRLAIPHHHGDVVSPWYPVFGIGPNLLLNLRLLRCNYFSGSIPVERTSIPAACGNAQK